MQALALRTDERCRAAEAQREQLNEALEQALRDSRGGEAAKRQADELLRIERKRAEAAEEQAEALAKQRYLDLQARSRVAGGPQSAGAPPVETPAPGVDPPAASTGTGLGQTQTAAASAGVGEESPLPSPGMGQAARRGSGVWYWGVK